MSVVPENKREPCPDRILDDMGHAFGLGAVGGSAFHFLKGVRNSPSGQRLVGGAQAVRMNAPRLGGSFAVWGGLFSAFDCASVYTRQKEDPWNSIIAGAATAGVLQMRHGVRASARSAAAGGAFLCLVEGGVIVLSKILSADQDMPDPRAGDGLPPRFQMPGHLKPPVAEGASRSWFAGIGGWLRSKNNKSGLSSGGVIETGVLERYDKALPNFDCK